MARAQLRWNTGSETARPQFGTPPGAPTAVTSIAADASATVSFLAPASSGSSSVTSYTVTPYIGGSPQSTTTLAAASTGSLVGSNGSTYRQMTITGLTNSTAYTFTVKAANSSGTGVESTASGANTPFSGLVFGDDFNGPAGGPVDPEWWIYDRCGYLSQSEVQWYKPDHCVLDGSGNLKLTAEHVSQTGTTYPTDGNRSITQPWTSGACQSNAKTWAPTSGNTMTFEVRQQVMTDAGSGYWPGLFWLSGQNYLDQWKTDPAQPGTDNTTRAEIDVAEWFMSFNPDNYGINVYGDTETSQSINTSAGLSTSMHVYQAQWKPGVSTKFFRDGSQTGTTVTTSTIVASSTTRFFLLLYLQMIAGGATTTESCTIDYVRVYDQNLG